MCYPLVWLEYQRLNILRLLKPDFAIGDVSVSKVLPQRFFLAYVRVAVVRQYLRRVNFITPVFANPMQRVMLGSGQARLPHIGIELKIIHSVKVFRQAHFI